MARRQGVAVLFPSREISLQANDLFLDALADDDPTPGKQAMQRLTTTKKLPREALARGTMPLAQQDAMLFKSLMAGERCLHGFTNRDIRSGPTGARWLRACPEDPKKVSAKVGRFFRRLLAHGPSPRSRARAACASPAAAAT